MNEQAVNAPLTPKRQRETPEYSAFARRTLRAYGRRVAEGDEVDLRELLTMRDEVEAAIETAVKGLKAQGHSWDYIAAGLGVSRQRAHLRYAAVCRDD